MLKTRTATVLGTIAAATMLTITTASAADGHQHATAVAGPDWDEFMCDDAVGARACFFHDGDWFSIEDRDKDGHSAVVKWKISTSYNGPAVRSGYIWNTSGNDTVRYMNKDFPELYDVYFYACEGNWSTKTIIQGSCGTGQSGLA
ncbi:hypothetical protein [Streptomyces coerulescens]|uniref:Secreted protein n=1 Tax=Streptomyces coerulescens TaxID=29304 RepID=A0ABW0CFV9_STRCD